MKDSDSEDLVRLFRESLREERAHQFEKRLELQDQIERRISNADKLIDQLSGWLTGLTVLLIAEAVAIALLWFE